MNIFGFEIKRKTEENENVRSFVEPNFDDGAVTIAAAGGHTSFIDLEGSSKSEAELIQKYRSMMHQPEVDQAVDDIVNEAINIDEKNKVVECVTDDLDLPDNIKKRITEEFENILRLLDFNNQGYEIFQKWYVDGRLNYHVMIDESDPKKGIQELRYIDPRKIRKVREYEKELKSNSGNNAYIFKKVKNEYYIYNDSGYNNISNTDVLGVGSSVGIKISNDSIVNCNSGVLNENNTLVLSHLHKAYKPLNQLRIMEDASVIYRISRAPERRVFYIDVGNLPKMKAEQYLRDMMTKHKNRLSYDIATGDVRDNRNHMSMTDDFWLPRRESGKGTEITTLPGGQNLGEIEDILYFQKRLFKALKVPISRLESESGFSLGRASEISRDEIKFAKFIRRLRSRFSILFDKCLEKQLILKGVISEGDWEDIKSKIRYDFIKDNHFEELKQSEILRNRLEILNDVDQHTGNYFSKAWVRSNVLMFNDNEIAEMKKEIEIEKKEEPDDVDL